MNTKLIRENRTLIFGLVPAVIVMALIAPGILNGNCGHLDAFEKTYTAAVGTRIDSCKLCHINPASGGPLNPYGTDFANNGYNFTAMEKLNSDSDGFTNIREINALTFPGDAMDFPGSPTVTRSIDGAALYENNCANCHGQLATSTKLGATAAQILAGINTVPAMEPVHSLNMAEIQAIAAALSQATSGNGGAALYASDCQGCHGSLSSSTKHGRTAAPIKNAISTVPAMNYLSFLSSDQITTIAAALSQTKTNSDGASLYADNCGSCHGPLSSSTKHGRTAAQIKDATSAVSAMNYISSLSQEDVSAIATALGASPTQTIQPSATPDGATLYATYCGGCHGSLSSTTAAGGSGLMIQGAISIVPQMNFLSALNPDQLNSIAKVLPGGSTIPASARSSDPVDTLDGGTLYSYYCSGCHGSLATTTATGASVTMIQGAIDIVPRMSYLSALSLDKINAIAGVLPVPTPTQTSSPTNHTPAQNYAAYCAVCHGANQQGGSGPAITPSGLGTLGITTSAQVNTFLTTGSMSSYASSMSSSDILALAQWLLPAGTPTPTPAPVPTNHTPVQNYAAYCAGCHGANQQGGSGPAITPSGLGTLGITTSAQVNTFLTTGSMSSYASSMSSSDILALTQWLLPAGTPTPTPAPVPTNHTPAQNYALYCSGCHGTNQQGGSGPAISATILASLGFTTTQINNIITNGSGSGTSSMPGFGNSMSTSYITALSQWLLAGTSPPTTLDGATLYADNCASCHRSFANTSIGGASVTQISGAIRSESRMSSLSILSSAQIQAISNALAGRGHCC